MVAGHEGCPQVSQGGKRTTALGAVPPWRSEETPVGQGLGQVGRDPGTGRRQDRDRLKRFGLS